MALLLSCKGYSQFQFYMVLPGSTDGIAYGDTLLHSSAVLKREGIRKITILRNPHEKNFRDITILLNQNGQVISSVSCTGPFEENKNGFCIRDTIIYDDVRGIVERRSKDGGGKINSIFRTEFENAGKVKGTVIYTDMHKPIPDTTISYNYYNENGQLIRFQQGGEKSDYHVGSIFYNTDGLVDSIRYDNPSFGTYIFHHKQKRDKKEITYENSNHHFKWVYNSSGQCISRETKVKKPSPDHLNPAFTYPGKGETFYYYNTNGTLSKAVTKLNGKLGSSVYYSYEK